MQSICPGCKKLISSTAAFCEFCGHEVVSIPKELSLGKKLKIFILSIILAPLGVYWFFKYLKDSNAKNRMVGYIALLLTLGTFTITTVITISYVSTLKGYMRKYEESMNTYSKLGY